MDCYYLNNYKEYSIFRFSNDTNILFFWFTKTSEIDEHFLEYGDLILMNEDSFLYHKDKDVSQINKVEDEQEFFEVNHFNEISKFYNSLHKLPTLSDCILAIDLNLNLKWYN